MNVVLPCKKSPQAHPQNLYCPPRLVNGQRVSKVNRRSLFRLYYSYFRLSRTPGTSLHRRKYDAEAAQSFYAQDPHRRTTIKDQHRAACGHVSTPLRSSNPSCPSGGYYPAIKRTNWTSLLGANSITDSSLASKCLGALVCSNQRLRLNPLPLPPNEYQLEPFL